MSTFGKASLLIFLLFLAAPKNTNAQSITTEERFDDMFITAGYGTALGASLGAALLSFRSNPDENLKQVAIGASIGFITGSLLGSYVVFSPLFVAESPKKTDRTHSQYVSISPLLNGRNNSISGIKSEWIVAQF